MILKNKSGIRRTFLYIGFGCLLILCAMVHLKKVESKHFETTEKLPMDGMFPGESHSSYEQVIFPKQDKLLGFAIQFYQKEEGSRDQIEITLSDRETKEELGTWSRSGEQINGMEPEVFLLNRPLQAVKERPLVLEMNLKTGDGDQHISVGVTTQNHQNLPIMGELVVNDYVKENLILQMQLCYPSIKAFYYPIFLLILAACIGGVAVLAKYSPQNVFLIFMLVFGTSYFAAIPMLQVPDETGHFLRSFEISQGDWMTPLGVSGGGWSKLPYELLPEDMKNPSTVNYEVIRENLNHKMSADRLDVYYNPTQALYAPISYLPQAVGCLVGRLLTDRTVVVFYMGRLFNFITCTAFCYFAIKWIPLGKRFLLLLCCMPMYIQQMVSLSSDAFINAVALFLFAQIWKILVQQKQADQKQKWLLGITCGIVALCKVVYLPLCFLVCLLPSEKLYVSKKQAVCYKIGICTGSSLLNLGWMVLALRYMIAFQEGVNSGQQILYICTHPFSYCIVLLRTLMEKTIDWAGTMVGAKMCVLNVYTSMSLVVIYLLVLLFEMIILDTKEENNVPKYCKISSIIVFGLLFLITLTTLYIQWTALQHPIIEGFQGRYLIPILPLLALGLKKFKCNISQETILRYELAVIAVVGSSALLDIITYF